MEWKISPEPVPYEKAVAFMETRVQAIRDARADELVWLLEHPVLYTAGTGAKESGLIDTLGFPVYPSGRGGQYTYHGPGQRVAYVILDLKKRTPDVRLYVQNLERWIIASLAAFGTEGFIREGRVGVWVHENRAPLKPRSADRGLLLPEASGSSQRRAGRSGDDDKESKIAAIGVRVRKWVSYHGISLNVHPDLAHYRGIVPCGISDYGVTSLAALGVNATMQEVDTALKENFSKIF